MVKFGNHLNASVVEEWKSHYVPFAALRTLIESHPQSFEAAWREALQLTNTFYLCEKLKVISQLRTGTDQFKQQVADWTAEATAEENSNMLNAVLKIRNFGMLNVAGYRKSLKKHAKANGDKDIVARLLPELWCAAFHSDGALEEIQKHTTRAAPEWQEQEKAPLADELLFNPTSPDQIDRFGSAMKKIPSMASLGGSGAQSFGSFGDLQQLEHDMNQCISRGSSFENLNGESLNMPLGFELSDEIRFVKELGMCVGPDLKPKLVLHRGFHDKGDDLSRPIENTLPAFDQAWLAGFHLCECDIAGSLDHHLVLSHDVQLKRIALHPNEEAAKQVVETMDVAQIMALSLKSGVRVPLLQEVLQSACFIPNAKLVIELKPSITDVSSMLLQLFQTRPEFVKQTAVVMSFDLYLIHNIKEKYDEIVRPQIDSAALAEWDFVRAHPAAAEHPKFLWLSCDPSNAINQRTIAAGKWKDNEYLMDITDTQEMLKMIQRDTSKLDGVYLQFNPNYMTTNRTALDRLVAQCCVGMWDVQPDSLECCQALVDAGVSFVNTDLPASFLSGGLPKEADMKNVSLGTSPSGSPSAEAVAD